MKQDLKEMIEETELELIERFKRKFPNLTYESMQVLASYKIEKAIDNPLMTTEQKKSALYKLMKEI